MVSTITSVLLFMAIEYKYPIAVIDMLIMGAIARLPEFPRLLASLSCLKIVVTVY